MCTHLSFFLGVGEGEGRDLFIVSVRFHMTIRKACALIRYFFWGRGRGRGGIVIGVWFMLVEMLILS